MQDDQLSNFTDRREARALFQHLRGRDPNRPWPLLPILTFIAPGGGGKTTLISCLRTQFCSLPDGRAVIPYAQIDFTQADAPRTLLAILVTLRNLLQQLRDGQNKYLTFPRFDLGASVVLAAPTDGKPSLMSPEEVQSNLTSGSQFIASLSDTVDAVVEIADVIPVPLDGMTKAMHALLAGVKLTTRIPVVKELLQRIESGPGWRWYQNNTTDPGLRANAGIQNLLLRLQYLSTPGNPGRDYLVQDVLPAALINDLRAAINLGRVWSKSSNVVLFLDGFEALLNDPHKTGILLLERLTLAEHRKRGETDPLLIVIGSRQRLLEHDNRGLQPPSTPPPMSKDAQEADKLARIIRERWESQLPKDKSVLRLSDLHLEVWLHGFELADTQDYLLRLSKEKQAQTFADAARIQAIYNTTLGHPFSLALIAAAIVEAQLRGKEAEIDKLWESFVSPEIAPGHEDETIGFYLLSLFLRQLTDEEKDEMIFCSVPRELDAATLRVILQLPNDIKAQRRMDYYRKLTFMRALDATRIVFQRIVRTLLLQQLVPDPLPDSDYYQAHNRLREHFHRRAAAPEQRLALLVEISRRARIEEIYHALALGDPEPAITLALTALKEDHDLWEMLQEAVEQAPKGLISADIKQKAAEAQRRIALNSDPLDNVTVIVLNKWISGDILKPSSR